MSSTEFAMVDELASLVKDNLPCKHLLLSMESAFVNFLQDEKRSDGLLELEPTNAYNRLLLHRLAEIFGLAHESVGEGDDRHLVLERRPGTSMPSILLSDILDHCDEQAVGRFQNFQEREGFSSVLLIKSSEGLVHEEREPILAHLDRKRRPRCSPSVACRMIAHALGKSVRDCKPNAVQGTRSDVQDRTGRDLSPRTKSRQKVTNPMDTKFIDYRSQQHKSVENNRSTGGIDVSHGERILDKKGNSSEEQIVAARRMFAHAIRLRTN